MNNNRITFTFSKSITGSLVALFDRYNVGKIQTTKLKNYYDTYLNISRIDKYELDIVDGYAELNVRNYNVSSVFYEIYDEKNTLLTNVNMRVTSEGIYFENLKGSKLITLYLLPIHSILTNLNIIKVNETNIRNFLAMYNPFTKEIKAWFGND